MLAMLRNPLARTVPAKDVDSNSAWKLPTGIPTLLIRTKTPRHVPAMAVNDCPTPKVPYIPVAVGPDVVRKAQYPLFNQVGVPNEEGKFPPDMLPFVHEAFVSES